ncbi:MAG: hypothetical protein ACRDAU_09930 [Clostridium sp.]
MININSLIDFVLPYYTTKDIMHDLSHIERVLKYVKKLILDSSYRHINMDIITYATYFHGFIYSDEEAIVTWLKTQDVSNEDIDKIITVAWESQKYKSAKTLEGKLLHDAHMIEGGKNYLIVKSLITGSLRGQTLDETISYIENNLLSKGTCYLPVAQKIYHSQQKFTIDFIKDLKEGLL